MAAADHRLIAANCEDKGDEPSPTQEPTGIAQPHTSGPWLYTTSEYEGPTVFTDAVDVAEVCWTDNAEANARLIAAAPDLLEALKAVKEHDDFVPVLPRSVLAKLNAAILKAEAGQ